MIYKYDHNDFDHIYLNYDTIFSKQCCLSIYCVNNSVESWLKNDCIGRIHWRKWSSSYYEWAKRAKFLLTVIYGLPRRHSNSFKMTFNDIQTALSICMVILRLAESITMKRPDRNALWPPIYWSKSSICAIKIWDRYLWQFGNYALIGNVAISVIFSSFSS